MKSRSHPVNYAWILSNAFCRTIPSLPAHCRPFNAANPAALLGTSSNSYANGISGSLQVGYGSGVNTGSNKYALLWTGTAASGSIWQQVGKFLILNGLCDEDMRGRCRSLREGAVFPGVEGDSDVHNSA